MSSVSASSSVSRQANLVDGSSYVERCRAATELVAGLQAVGMGADQIFSILVGTGVEAVDSRGGAASRVGVGRKGRRRRGGRSRSSSVLSEPVVPDKGASTAVVQSAVVGQMSPEKVKDFPGYCYSTLMRAGARAPGLTTYPTFGSVLSSALQHWDMGRIRSTFVRRENPAHPEVYHVATSGVPTLQALAGLAAAHAIWPPGSLGEHLAPEFQPSDLDGVIKLNSVLGGDADVMHRASAASAGQDSRGSEGRTDEQLSHMDRASAASAGQNSRGSEGWTDEQLSHMATFRESGRIEGIEMYEAFIPAFAEGRDEARPTDAGVVVHVVEASSEGTVLPSTRRPGHQRWFAPAGCSFESQDRSWVFPRYDDLQLEADSGQVVTVAWRTAGKMRVRFPKNLWGQRVALRRYTGMPVSSQTTSANAHLLTTYAHAVVHGVKECTYPEAPITIRELIDEDDDESFVTLRVTATVNGASMVNVDHADLGYSSAWLLHGVAGGRVCAAGGAEAFGGANVALEGRQYLAMPLVTAGVRNLGVHVHGHSVRLVMLPDPNVREMQFCLSRVGDDFAYDDGGPDMDDNFDPVLWRGGDYGTPLVTS